jgi:P27 family predicted phage terminase small subunit
VHGSRQSDLVEQRVGGGEHRDQHVPADGREAEILSDFERVLVDAPCSDLGALASRPDARWRKSPDVVERLTGLQAGLLDRADAPALEAAARCIDRWRRAEDTLDAEGLVQESHGGTHAHPCVAIAAKAQAEYRAWCARLGLTPVDRVSLGLASLRGQSLAQDIGARIGDEVRVDILDGRRASLRFRAADSVELATGAAFSQISVDGDEPICIGGVDIADALLDCRTI